MATFKRFEDIEAWQAAKKLCSEIRAIIETTGLNRDFALRNQVNSSSGSVMDNIAEGFGRGGNIEFINFLTIAHGSRANASLNFTGYMSGHTLMNRNLSRYMRLLMKQKIR